jgi:hypothetical protein
VRTKPTELVAVGRKLNVISFQRKPSLPVSGLLLRRRDGRFAIQYAPSGSARFTLAHELGHAYLQQSGDQPKDEEGWCDRFAAELLMPTELIDQDLEEGFDLKRLLDIADSFQVSVQAAAVRCTEFRRMGALAADEGGLLWRVGEVRGLDPHLEDRIAHILQTGRTVEEAVSFDGEDWLLEGCPFPRRPSNALILVRPAS